MPLLAKEELSVSLVGGLDLRGSAVAAGSGPGISLRVFPGPPCAVASQSGLVWPSSQLVGLRAGGLILHGDLSSGCPRN